MAEQNHLKQCMLFTVFSCAYYLNCYENLTDKTLKKQWTNLDQEQLQAVNLNLLFTMVVVFAELTLLGNCQMTLNNHNCNLCFAAAALPLQNDQLAEMQERMTLCNLQQLL